MRAPVKLLAFGAVLLAVFGLAVVGARAFLPAAPAAAPAATAEREPAHGHKDSGQDQHGQDQHGQDQHGQDQHGQDQHASPAADPVRGLAASQDGYRIEAVGAPRDTRRAGVLSFELIGPDGPVTDYTTNHEKDLHLIVVRSDGRHFRHVHPRTDGQGGWSLPWRWDAAGSYRIFADFVPASTGETLTLTSSVDVAGAFDPARPGPDTSTAAVADYSVTLDGKLTAGKSSSLTFTITRDGRPVGNLQPYLGAAGHLVALRSGDLAYLHVHPTDHAGGESGPEIRFSAEPPTPGRYLLYLDFQVDGQVHTAAFTRTAR